MHVYSCEHQVCPAHPPPTPHSQPFKSLGLPRLPQSPSGQFHSCLAGVPQFQYEGVSPFHPWTLMACKRETQPFTISHPAAGGWRLDGPWKSPSSVCLFCR